MTRLISGQKNLLYARQIVAGIPFRKLPQAFPQRCLRGEAEVPFQGRGVRKGGSSTMVAPFWSLKRRFTKLAPMKPAAPVTNMDFIYGLDYLIFTRL